MAAACAISSCHSDWLEINIPALFYVIAMQAPCDSGNRSRVPPARKNPRIHRLLIADYAVFSDCDLCPRVSR